QVWLAVILLYAISVAVRSSPDEYRLLSDLRHNYDPYERPVANSSDPLKVSIKLYLQQILDVDEKNQVITLVAWIEYTWSDYKLKWDPSEYGGINDIRIPGTANAIWKPDVLLYNSADENFDSTYPVNYVVSHTGDVLHVPPGIMKLSCKIDITWFPFDDQICWLKFGSWTYSGSFIDLRISPPNDTVSYEVEGMDRQYYVDNGEWNLLTTPARNETKIFDGEPYPAVYFYLIIQRRTLYYGLNLIIPSLLISLMTVLGFTLPPDAGEKITLEITILLSVCFFLSMVADMTPPTSEAVPLIGAFFSCCMLVVSASVVFTVLLRQCLLVWMPWFLMMRRPGTTVFSRENFKFMKAQEEARKLTAAVTVARQSDRNQSADSLSLLRSVRVEKTGFHTPPDPPEYTMHNGSYCTHTGIVTTHNCSKKVHSAKVHNALALPTKSPMDSAENETSNGLLSEMNRCMQKACVELKTISVQLGTMRKRMEEDERDEQAENDWKFAAMVVDRMCLITFTIFIVVSTCGIMFSSPHLIA
ncbi:hypothetical protein PFISCL1PPCAC_27636, partial [Pristionchus fissidentatus]